MLYRVRKIEYCQGTLLKLDVRDLSGPFKELKVLKYRGGSNVRHKNTKKSALYFTGSNLEYFHFSKSSINQV